MIIPSILIAVSLIVFSPLSLTFPFSPPILNVQAVAAAEYLVKGGIHMGNFCPFLKDLCENSCVFKVHNTATSYGISTCLIAIKLDSINDQQSMQLDDIISRIPE